LEGFLRILFGIKYSKIRILFIWSRFGERRYLRHLWTETIHMLLSYRIFWARRSL